MEGYCSTGQSPQWAVVPVEGEEEEFLALRSAEAPARLEVGGSHLVGFPRLHLSHQRSTFSYLNAVYAHKMRTHHAAQGPF
jgi:hypothetical protein